MTRASERVPWRERLRWRWQFQVRQRLVRVGLLRRLPWRLWLFLCAWDAPSVIAEIGRRENRPLRFVQVGSNDGVANDPLHETAISRGWTGVCVEPLPQLYERLVANYRDASGIECANVAIAGEGGMTVMYSVEPRHGDPPWVDQLASLDAEVIRRHAYALPDLEDRIREVQVPTLSLGELVAHHDLGTIDLIHVDAEGYDAEIVDQIPLEAAWAPTYVIFERKHLAPDRLEVTMSRLRRGGYRSVSLWPDLLVHRRVRLRRTTRQPARWTSGRST